MDTCKEKPKSGFQSVTVGLFDPIVSGCDRAEVYKVPLFLTGFCHELGPIGRCNSVAYSFLAVF